MEKKPLHVKNSPIFSPDSGSEETALEFCMFHAVNADNSQLVQAQTVPGSARLAHKSLPDSEHFGK
jgi:hypothetical protein